MTDAPHAITKLTLENFRNYRSLQLNVPPRPVVLRGHNGAGKTNILEAISLLAPGRGFRHAKLSAMDAIGAGGAPWVVAAQLTTRGEENHIGTGRDAEASTEKRLIKINVFVEGGSARRKLLDRIVYGFEPEHAARVNAYETATRERNRLLIDRALNDPYWLSVLEQQMAEHAVAITLARLELLSRLQDELLVESSAFPRALLSLEGTLETWLAQGQSALEVEASFAERLRELRGPDGASGRTSEGAHRSQFTVIHREKSMPVEHCSTGEQKALLLSIILAAARARAAWCGLPPILLLDEVIAHLDVDKRVSLFDLIRQGAIQAWMTGTDAADFQGLQGFATTLEIAGGTVQVEVENR